MKKFVEDYERYNRETAVYDSDTPLWMMPSKSELTGGSSKGKQWRIQWGAPGVRPLRVPFFRFDIPIL